MEITKRTYNGVFASQRTRVTFVYFLTMVLMSLKAMIFYSPLGDRLSTNGMDRLWTITTQIICMGVIPLALYMLVTYKGGGFGAMLKNTFSDFGYRKIKDYKIWLVVIAIALLFFFFTMVISQIFYTFIVIAGFTQVSAAGTIYGGVGDLFMWLFFSAVLPAVFEEFTHRGLLLNGLQDRGSEASIILLTSLMFALMHTNILQCGYAFVGGLIMGYVTVRTGSIFPAMIIHFSVNALSTIEEYSSQYNGFFARIMQGYYSMFDTGIGFIFLLLLWLAIVALMVLLLMLLSKLTTKADNRPKTMIFGKLEVGIMAKGETRSTALENVFLYAAIAMLAFQTVASFIWGFLR